MTTPEMQMPTPPTSDTAEQRREIEATRTDMGRTLERIEDRVSPSRIKQRQAAKVRGSWQRMKDRVMGSADDMRMRTGEGMSDMAGRAQEAGSGLANDTREAMEHAPDRIEEATRGNPLAAGLIAAGVGALAGTLLPTSRQERRLATGLRDEFEEPVRSELQDAGHEMAEHLKEEGQHAADEVKSAAKDATERTQEQAKSSTQQVRDGATQPDASSGPGRRS